MHMYIAEARVRHALARLGQPGAVAARLAALAERTDGTLVTVLAADAAALAGAAPGTSKRPGTPSRRWGYPCWPRRRTWPQRRLTGPAGWPARQASRRSGPGN